MTRSITDESKFKGDLIALIPHMRAFARSLCHNTSEADDLAQETLAKAWAKRDRFEMGTNLKAWTFMILRNHFYSEKRRSWRSQPLDQEIAERTLVAVTSADASIELDDLRRAMIVLAPEQREALILVGAGGASYEEAAEIMGCAVGTVKSRVSRARRTLLSILETQSFLADGLAPSRAMENIFEQLRSYRLPDAA